MVVELSTPEPCDLEAVVDALRDWQDDVVPVQLHPGDVGWHRRLGDEATLAALRVWRRDGRVLAVGLTDDDVVRLAAAPDVVDDGDLARRIADDVEQAAVEARFGGALVALLLERGWRPDEPWTPLRRSLADPVEDPGVRVVTVGPAEARARVDIQVAAFERSTFSLDRWRTMAATSSYADARCLLAHDDQGAAVAAVTVWSAGPGRPGLLEPMGVHRDHRGHGYGTAISVAAAAALRDLGSSSATVCTPSANVGGVATHRVAGFTELPEVRDLRRPA